jgi:hypothetical protein
MATWFKSMFFKKPSAIKVEETVEDKKQILREYNKEKVSNDYDMVLSQTVRESKPREFSKRKEVNVETPIGDFKLTKKQERFLDIISKANCETGINMAEVCQKFLDFKYKGTQMNPTEDELKPNYHKKTIKFLEKCQLIIRVENTKNHYRVNY